jgi:hypothetical protein
MKNKKTWKNIFFCLFFHSDNGGRTKPQMIRLLKKRKKRRPTRKKKTGEKKGKQYDCQRVKKRSDSHAPKKD